MVVIAGGTGITPSFQLIKQIVENPEDTTHVVLIFANHGACETGKMQSESGAPAPQQCSRILEMILPFLELFIGGIRLSSDKIGGVLCHEL